MKLGEDHRNVPFRIYINLADHNYLGVNESVNTDTRYSIIKNRHC